MKVCLLSDREVGRLQNYLISPSCEEHRHVSPIEAIEAMAEGLLEAVPCERASVTESKLHTLAVRPSGGIPVVQRIVGNGLKHVQEAR